MTTTRHFFLSYLHDDLGLVVALVVDDAGAVDEVDALHERDVLPHLGLPCESDKKGRVECVSERHCECSDLLSGTN